MFSIKRPSTVVHNLILGEMYLEHTGSLVCKRYTAEGEQEELVLTLKKAGWNKSNIDQIEAEMPLHPGSNKVWKVYGKWNDAVYAKNEETDEVIEIWKANPDPEGYEMMYHFTNFTLRLNQLNDDIKRSIPPTDSRLRPD